MLRNVAPLIIENTLRRCRGDIDWDTAATIQTLLWKQARRIGNASEVYDWLNVNDADIRTRILAAIDARGAR